MNASDLKSLAPALPEPGDDAAHPRLLHLITSVGVGGAQTMLAKLLEQQSGSRARYDQSVLSLMPPADLAPRILAAGVPLHTADARSSIPSPRATSRLVTIVRQVRPALIVGWMHHGATAGWLAAKALRPLPRLIWNVRHSLSDMSHEKPVSRLLLQLNARLSPGISAIIYNSHLAREQYAAHAYCDERAVVIPNGFDCSLFRPRQDARKRLEQTFHLPPGRAVVGMVARWHPMKDPATLIAAMRRLCAEDRDLHLLIVGTGMQDLRSHLESAFEGLPADRVTLADQRLDVAEWLPGLDLLVLPSAWGEGFPNVLGEAMACGVPCIATDIGDSRWVIGEHGWIVPARDPEAMASAIRNYLELPAEGARQLRQQARGRIQANFSLEAVSASYTELYDKVLASPKHG